LESEKNSKKQNISAAPSESMNSQKQKKINKENINADSSN
jgi:hypothetical protein